MERKEALEMLDNPEVTGSFYQALERVSELVEVLATVHYIGHGLPNVARTVMDQLLKRLEDGPGFPFAGEWVLEWRSALFSRPAR